MLDLLGPLHDVESQKLLAFPPALMPVEAPSERREPAARWHLRSSGEPEALQNEIVEAGEAETWGELGPFRQLL